MTADHHDNEGQDQNLLTHADLHRQQRPRHQSGKARQ